MDNKKFITDSRLQHNSSQTIFYQILDLDLYFLTKHVVYFMDLHYIKSLTLVPSEKDLLSLS